MTPEMHAQYLSSTFGSIAQTLAAALAVTVAFVAFRLPALDQTVQRGKALLYHYGGPLKFDRLWRILREEGEPAMTQALGPQLELGLGSSDCSGSQLSPPCLTSPSACWRWLGSRRWSISHVPPGSCCLPQGSR
jgi:hypothetical protein